MDSSDTKGSDAVFACGICGETFSSRNNLFRHLKNTDEVHVRQDQAEPAQESTKKRKTLAADEGIYTVSEDAEWYRLVVKPQGLATMGPKGMTLLKSDKLLLPDAIKLQLSYKKAVPCHRLDRATGGIMLCSKSKLAERILYACFRYKLVQKKYLAVVVGKLEPAEGIIDTPISGKAALTKYSVSCYTPSKQYGWITTVELWPITGKNHQLRRHLQSVGHSIVGDKRYSMPTLWSHIVRTPIDSMFLWAVEIVFPHPQYCTELVPSGVEEQDIPDLAAKMDDENSSDDEEAEEELELLDQGAGHGENGSAIGRSRAEVAAELRSLSKDKLVTGCIPEPTYYAEFREIHASSVL
eukprot:gene17661-20116_t